MPRSNPESEECIELVTHSKIKVEEGGRKAVFLNLDQSLVKKVTVDGCLDRSTSPKADYIVSKPGFVDVIVELKGKNVAHAKDQIIATFLMWRGNPAFSAKIAGLIVCSKSPMSSSDLQIMKKKVLNRHQLWLEVDETGKKEYQFSTFEQST
jgi:hypothetical protein